MHNVSKGMKRYRGYKLLSIVLVLICLASPLAAIAETVTPAQILPAHTGKSCSPVTFSDIHPYIYDSHLDSFDITISDSRYVAISTSVGETAVPYRYITRWNNPDGSVRMHVDLVSTSLSNDLNVQIAFLAAQTDSLGFSITCIMNISTIIKGTGQTTEGQGNEHIYIPITKPADQNGGSATSTPVVKPSSSNAGLVSAMSSLGKLCTDGGGSRLWLVLLVLYVLFVITLCSQQNDADSSSREWNIVLILGVFLVLLVFWYVSSTCRSGPWAPAFATLIAVAGLLYSILSDEKGTEPLLLRDHNDN